MSECMRVCEVEAQERMRAKVYQAQHTYTREFSHKIIVTHLLLYALQLLMARMAALTQSPRLRARVACAWAVLCFCRPPALEQVSSTNRWSEGKDKQNIGRHVEAL